MSTPDPKIVKNSRVVEVMLIQASQFLCDPSQYQLAKWTKEQYEADLRLVELTESMLELEAIAMTHGAKSAFWRRLKKVAIQLELDDKIEEYETRFHKALKVKRT